MITFGDIESARDRLQGVSHLTPVLTSRSLNDFSGNRLFFKCENFQRIGAFKIRGAYNKIASLSQDRLKPGVVAFSSGNHAQGVALAARLMKTSAKIVMPDNSPRVKLDATKAYGAEIIIYDFKKENRETIGRRIAEQEGRILVPPFNDDHVIAGQGTVGLEFGTQVNDLDYVFFPVGGGGLVSGSSIALKQLRPTVKIIGVETQSANDGQMSFRNGKIVSISPPATIADGMRTTSLGDRTFEIIMKYIDDMVVVSDQEVVEAMRWIYTRLKIVVEPTAAVPLAAVLRNEAKLSGKNIGIVLSGGNIEIDSFFDLLKQKAVA